MPAQIELEELLEAIRTDGPRSVVQTYRRNLLSSRLLIDLYSEHPEPDVFLFLALYPTVPSQLLEDLTGSCQDPEVLAAAATNPRCAPLQLIQMAQQGGAPVRAALAANRQIGPKVIAGLVRDTDLSVRLSLARNSTLPNHIQVALLLDSEPAVRAALAGVPKLSLDLLYALCSDESAVVRAMLYAFGKVGENMLLSWAASDDVEAQRLMLTRKKLSDEVVEALCCSPDLVVQQTVFPRHHPDPCELLAQAESDNDVIRVETACRDGLPSDIQHVLAADPLSEVRAALAENPSVDEAVALCITASNDLIACKALAGNPAASEDVRRELCHHDAVDVRLRMAYRDDLTEEFLDILINQHEDLDVMSHLAFRGIRFADINAEHVEQIISHKRASLRAFCAVSNQLTSAQALRLVRDESPVVRRALCDNLVLSRTFFEELAQDWNLEVRKAAECRLETCREEPPGDEDEFYEDEETGLVSRFVRFFTE